MAFLTFLSDLVIHIQSPELWSWDCLWAEAIRQEKTGKTPKNSIYLLTVHHCHPVLAWLGHKSTVLIKCFNLIPNLPVSEAFLSF
jgi:hypothetical protein